MHIETRLVLTKQHESDVIEGLFRGYGNDEIAKRYNIKQRTVKSTLARLFVRYGIPLDKLRQSPYHSRIKLAVKLYNAGLCPCRRCRQRAGTADATGFNLGVEVFKTTERGYYQTESGSEGLI
jgi:hypothetical protein